MVLGVLDGQHLEHAPNVQCLKPGNVTPQCPKSVGKGGRFNSDLLQKAPISGTRAPHPGRDPKIEPYQT